MITRRDLVAGVPALAFTALGGTLPGGQPLAQSPDAPSSEPWPGFPRLDAELVYEVVLVAHSNEARVRELVAAHPPLVNAWWDWGFGDWESPLGAASHVGQRGIAAFLIERGARVDIFAAAMLGMNEVVSAFVAATPGVQRTLGPHGITLLAHARAGGAPAAATVGLLERLGDADTGLPVVPLPTERQSVYPGTYLASGNVRVVVSRNTRGQLMAEVQTGHGRAVSRPIHHAGDDEFFPAGVPGVRFRFTVVGEQARSVVIRAASPILTAARVGE